MTFNEHRYELYWKKVPLCRLCDLKTIAILNFKVKEKSYTIIMYNNECTHPENPKNYTMIKTERQIMTFSERYELYLGEKSTFVS